MSNTFHPSYQLARDYLKRRTHSTEPPTSPEDIRQELGWVLILAERQAQAELDERN